MMTSQPISRVSASDYLVACICTLRVEMTTLLAIFDEVHENLPTSRYQNAYRLGKIGGHNVVIAMLAEKGNNSSATTGIQLLNDFPNIRIGLLVGIAGGLPQEGRDLRLGDVVVSRSTSETEAVVQYDRGKELGHGQFRRTGSLNKPPKVLSANVLLLESHYQRFDDGLSRRMSDLLQRCPTLQAECSLPAEPDQLFVSSYEHQSGSTCDQCDEQQTVPRSDRMTKGPKIHYGPIGSANLKIENATLRDNLSRDGKFICVEMEAAGLMDDFPCLPIRGICDYADSHKNKTWQGYAALAAAAYTKDLLCQISPKEAQAQELVRKVDANNHERDRGLNSTNPASLLQTSTVWIFVLLLAVLLMWHRAQNIVTGQQFNNKGISAKQIFNYGRT